MWRQIVRFVRSTKAAATWSSELTTGIGGSCESNRAMHPLWQPQDSEPAGSHRMRHARSGCRGLAVNVGAMLSIWPALLHRDGRRSFTTVQTASSLSTSSSRRPSGSGCSMVCCSWPWSTQNAPDDQHDFAGEIGIDSDHGFLTNAFRVDEGGISAIM